MRTKTRVCTAIVLAASLAGCCPDQRPATQNASVRQVREAKLATGATVRLEFACHATAKDLQGIRFFPDSEAEARSFLESHPTVLFSLKVGPTEDVTVSHWELIPPPGAPPIKRPVRAYTTCEPLESRQLMVVWTPPVFPVCLLAYPIPGEWSSVTLVIYVGTGPWKTVADSNGRTKDTNLHVEFSQPAREGDTAGIDVGGVPDDDNNREFRIVAIRKDGQRIISSSGYPRGKGSANGIFGRGATTTTFPARPEEIREYRVETRQCVRVEFANVRLESGGSPSDKCMSKFAPAQTPCR